MDASLASFHTDLEVTNQSVGSVKGERKTQLIDSRNIVISAADCLAFGHPSEPSHAVNDLPYGPESERYDEGSTHFRTKAAQANWGSPVDMDMAKRRNR